MVLLVRRVVGGFTNTDTDVYCTLIQLERDFASRYLWPSSAQYDIVRGVHVKLHE